MNILQTIFSVTNERGKNKKFYKVWTILGIKFKFTNKEKNINNLQTEVQNLYIKNDCLNSKLFHLKTSIIENAKNPYFHYNAFSIGNAGDNILVDSMKKSINLNLSEQINFISQSARHYLSNEDIYLINKSNGVIIGGGGLFLKDTNANEISGWQMPISSEQIKSINVPIYLLGVGYNRFRGQDDFEPFFTTNINVLVEKAKFVGLRNNGSIRALKPYLRDDLKEKLSFHPCATTVLSKIYNIPKGIEEEPFIAINCAFDREHLRYGENKDNILNSIAKTALKLSKHYKIKYYVHVGRDCRIFPYFDNLGLKYEVVYLNKPINEFDFLKLYSAPKLVIGMRGHAQMIPFGCGTPILSIISHDKMNWFLEDIGHTEWGVDVLEDDFENKLYDKSIGILSNNEIVKSEIQNKQDFLYSVIRANISKLFENSID